MFQRFRKAGQLPGPVRGGQLWRSATASPDATTASFRCPTLASTTSGLPSDLTRSGS
ncbi:MAG: hypothetical protein ACRDS0_38780 [Pseudonocardiaceae bacterium]